MGLSRFPAVMDAAVEAVLKTADAMRHVRDARGDLLWSALDAMQDGLRQSKATTYATFVDATKQPESAEAHLKSLGGPATLADYQDKAVAVELAAASWNHWLQSYLGTLPATTLIGLVVRSDNGVETKHIERGYFIPAELAAPLRACPQLAALINAFEAVGA